MTTARLIIRISGRGTLDWGRGTKFTYENGQGWRRIKATSAHGSPIFDAPYYCAHLTVESDLRKSSRIIMAKSAVILVVEIIIIKVLISPEPLSVLLELERP